jgi:hypothetical protein
VAWELGAAVNSAKLCYLGVWRQALGPFSKFIVSGAYLRKSFAKRAKKQKRRDKSPLCGADIKLGPCLDARIGVARITLNTVAILFLFTNNCPNID